MRTLKTLRPGHKGTRELVARYGTSLLCVRHRFRRPQTRARQDRGADHPASLGGTHAAASSGADGRAPGRPDCRLMPARRGPYRSWGGSAPAAAFGAESRSPHPLGRDRAAPADQVRRWLVGPHRRLWLLRRDHAERLGLLHRVAAGGGG